MALLWTLRQFLLLLFLVLATVEASAPVAGNRPKVGGIQRGPAVSTLETVFFSLNTIAKHPNVVFSPFSILEALKAAAEGATGECAEDLGAFLHTYPPVSPLFHVPLLERTGALKGSLQQHADDAFIVDILSKAIVDKCYAQRSAFKKYMERVAANMKHSKADTADFHAPERTATELNTLVEEVTRGKIKQLVRPESLAHHRLVLLNAIYFKAKWWTPFDPQSTSRQDFYSYTNQGLTPTRTDFMTNVLTPGSYIYSTQRIGDHTITVVGLPYVDGASYLFLYMPQDVSTFDLLLKTNAHVLSSLAERAVLETNSREEPLMVLLPKFHLKAEDNKHNGWSILTLLGLQSCMRVGMGAFEGISGDDALYLSGFDHTANLDVDEDGTEAAAATAVIFVDHPQNIPNIPTVIFNHPFYFQLISRSPRLSAKDDSDVVLFTGRFGSV